MVASFAGNKIVHFGPLIALPPGGAIAAKVHRRAAELFKMATAKISSKSVKIRGYFLKENLRM